MSVETSAKTKLAALMNDVQPVIDSHIAEMNSSEINYMLDKIPEFLRIDLKRDLEKAKKDASTLAGKPGGPEEQQLNPLLDKRRGPKQIVLQRLDPIRWQEEDGTQYFKPRVRRQFKMKKEDEEMFAQRRKMARYVGNLEIACGNDSEQAIAWLELLIGYEAWGTN